LRPAPAVVLPPNLERLDPAVQTLISSQAAAVAARPREASTHGDLGLVYEANLLWPEARRCFEYAASLDPGEMLWKLHLAIAYRQTGGPQEALAQLRELVKQHPNFSYLQQRLGEALLEAGELNEAESAFRKVIELAPVAAQGYTGLGDILLQRQDYYQAAPPLEKAVALDPDYRTAHYLLGSVYQRLGMEEKAKLELAQGKNAAVRFLPDPATGQIQRYAVNLTTRLQQAKTTLQEGKAREAAQLLEPMLVHHPENVSLLNELAVAYMRLGQFNEVEALLRKARQRPESQFMTLINFSSLMFRTDSLRQALAYADSAVTQAPNVDQAHFSRGQALWRLGRYQEALASLQEAARLNPQNPQNHSFAGDLYIKAKEYEKARQAYQSALALDAKMLPALVGLARANWALGRRAEAEAAYVQAKQFAPDHPLVRRLEQEILATTR